MFSTYVTQRNATWYEFFNKKCTYECMYVYLWMYVDLTMFDYMWDYFWYCCFTPYGGNDENKIMKAHTKSKQSAIAWQYTYTHTYRYISNNTQAKIKNKSRKEIFYILNSSNDGCSNVPLCFLVGNNIIVLLVYKNTSANKLKKTTSTYRFEKRN